MKAIEAADLEAEARYSSKARRALKKKQRTVPEAGAKAGMPPKPAAGPRKSQPAVPQVSSRSRSIDSLGSRASAAGVQVRLVDPAPAPELVLVSKSASRLVAKLRAGRKARGHRKQRSEPGGNSGGAARSNHGQRGGSRRASAAEAGRAPSGSEEQWEDFAAGLESGSTADVSTVAPASVPEPSQRTSSFVSRGSSHRGSRAELLRRGSARKLSGADDGAGASRAGTHSLFKPNVSFLDIGDSSASSDDSYSDEEDDWRDDTARQRTPPRRSGDYAGSRQQAASFHSLPGAMNDEPL